MRVYYAGMGTAATAPPLAAGMKDCGGGLSVRLDLDCPMITPIDPNDPRVIAAQADYTARAARCHAYQAKEYTIDAAVGALAALILPGWWSLLAIPAVLITEAYYPKSPDCDYGW